MPTASPAEIGTFVAILIALAGAFWGWRAHQRAERAEVEPRHEPPLHRQYATREEHRELSGRVDKLDDKIEENFKELQQERSKSIAGLHKRIEDVGAGMNERIGKLAEALAEFRGEMKGKS